MLPMTGWSVIRRTRLRLRPQRHQSLRTPRAGRVVCVLGRPLVSSHGGRGLFFGPACDTHCDDQMLGIFVSIMKRLRPRPHTFATFGMHDLCV